MSGRFPVISAKVLTASWPCAWVQCSARKMPGICPEIARKLPGKCPEFARNPNTITLYNFTANLHLVTSKVGLTGPSVIILYASTFVPKVKLVLLNRVIDQYLYTCSLKSHQAIAVLIHMAEWKFLCLQTIIYMLIYVTGAQIMYPELHMTNIHQS